MKIKETENVLQSEINLLKDVFCQILRIPNDFKGWGDIYKIASEELKNNIDITGIDNAEDLMNKIGITDLSEDFELYIINEMPEDIYKMNWKNMKILWEKIWCPPMDDGLLLYVPNHKLVLLTHWDVVYYN